MLDLVRLPVFKRHLESPVQIVPVIRINRFEECLVAAPNCCRFDLEYAVALIGPAQYFRQVIQFPTADMGDTLASASNSRFSRNAFSISLRTVMSCTVPMERTACRRRCRSSRNVRART